MATLAAADGAVVAGPRIATESLRAVLLWLMAFSGGFVFIEPGPYEFVGMATMFLFTIMGLTLRASLAPLILLLTLLNIGYALSLFELSGQTAPTIWVLVSVFLSLTAIFYAAMLGTNTEARLRWLLRGYVAAAVVVSLLAIAGYFGLFGGRFVVYSRATGTFKDPNVFAAFLILPGLLILQRMLAGRRSAFHRRRHPAADRHRRPVSVVLARRLGPIRILRDPADGVHLRDQPLGQRALPDRHGCDHRRRGGSGVRRGAAVRGPGGGAVRGTRVAVAKL